MDLFRKPNFHVNDCAGAANRPRDTPAILIEALGLAGDASSEEWLRIKRTVQEILARHDLVGKLPSTIRNPAVKVSLGQELESAYPEAFETVQPAAYRRGLTHRIFVWEMKNSRRRMWAHGSQPPPPQPSLLLPPPGPPLLEPPAELPWDAEYSAIEGLEDFPMAEPSLSSALAAESSDEEPPSIEPSMVEPSSAEPSGAETSDAESSDAEVLSVETVEGSMDRALTPESPPARALAAEYLPVSEESPEMRIPKQCSASFPVATLGKEVIVTITAPPALGFQATFMKGHLLEGSVPSIKRLLKILTEERL